MASPLGPRRADGKYMTANVKSLAPPEPHLGTEPMPVTPRTAYRSDGRHRVVAIGSGLGGLTATKALKHDLVSMSDAVAFLTRLTAQATAHVHNQTALLEVTPTTGPLLTAAGVLITLYVVILPQRRSGAAAGDFIHQSSPRRWQRTGKGWR
jgi:hypothetical protein